VISSTRPSAAANGVGSVLGRRALQVLGIALLVVWFAWWTVALVELALPGAQATWLRVPSFGADFWSQPDWAVRIWDVGESPYDVDYHLFHYPPIVIQLFRWVVYFEPSEALRIWIAALMAIIALGTWVSWRGRRALGLRAPPFPLVLAAVLYGFPVVFALERSNFDLITMAAMVLAAGAMATPFRHRQLVAGALLSVGPWVKIYPGLIGLGLVALRWWRALVGFAVGGILIGVLEPNETMKSFRELQRLIAHHAGLEETGLATYFPWSHSVSALVRKAIVLLERTTGLSVPQKFPASLVALAMLAPLLIWVTRRVYRSSNAEMLAFPLLAWFVAAASFVPEVANDYSLVFLPVAAVGAWSRSDPWPVHAGMLVGLVAYQPVALPVDGFVLLAMKLSMLIAVAGSLVQRATALDVPAGPGSATSATT
jgi:hypothetical protein